MITKIIQEKLPAFWGDIEYFPEEGRTLFGGNWHFMGGFDNPLEARLYDLTLINL